MPSPTSSFPPPSSNGGAPCCAFEVSPAENLLMTRFVGSISSADFVGLYRWAYRDPDYRLGMCELVDLSGITEFDFATGDLHLLGEIVESTYAGSDLTVRTAVWAPTDLVYGMARMYQGLNADGPESVEVFRSLPDAREWLGVSGDV